MLGLLVELIDLAVLVGVEDTEAGRLLERNVDDRDGAGGILRLVVFVLLFHFLFFLHFLIINM